MVLFIYVRLNYRLKVNDYILYQTAACEYVISRQKGIVNEDEHVPGIILPSKSLLRMY